MHRVHQDEAMRERLMLDLDEIARVGARRMLAQALEAEVEAYLEAARDERDKDGRALVVRNGRARSRKVVCGAGAIEVSAPRVDDKRIHQESGQRMRFRSSILPPYVRRSPKVAEVLPLLYLHGLSGGDFVPALEEFFGSKAGLSATTIARLTEQWQEERERFMARDLSERDYVYVWVDGIHTRVRLGSDEHLCCLVMIGARLDGRKELVALQDGYRESEESWAELLRDLKKRGMRAPVLAIGDGALGFLGRGEGRFPADALATGLGPQDLQRPRRPTEERAWEGQEGDPRDHRGRKQGRSRAGYRGVRAGVRDQVAQGGSEDHRRERDLGALLRVPGRALDTLAHHQPDRVYLRAG
jgi:transposase-like protein